MPDDTLTTLTGLIRIDPASTTLEPLSLDPADFQSGLPVQNYHLFFEDEKIGLAVGIWDTTTMQETFGPYPGDEYITVLDGSFSMVDTSCETLATARTGDSVTFRNGVPGSWKQDGYLRKIYLTLQDPKGQTPDIAAAEGGFRVVEQGRKPNGNPDADGVTREVIFRNDAGNMTVTLCTFAVQNLPGAPCPTHRLMRVLKGTITLTEPFGTPKSFGPGTHVFLPKGTVCAAMIAEGAVAILVDVTAPSGAKMPVVSLGVDADKDDPIGFLRPDSLNFADSGRRIERIDRIAGFCREADCAIEQVGVNTVNALESPEIA